MAQKQKIASVQVESAKALTTGMHALTAAWFTLVSV